MDGKGTGSLSTEISVGFEMLTSNFRSRVDLEPCKRVHAVSEPNEYMEHLSFTWNFAPVGDSACRLDLALGAPSLPTCNM